MIHIPMLPVYYQTRVRQRCAWCGIALVDQDLSRVGVQELPEDQCAVCFVSRARHDEFFKGITEDEFRSPHEFCYHHQYLTWEPGSFVEYNPGEPIVNIDGELDTAGGASWVVADAAKAATLKVSELDGECCLDAP